MGVIFEVPLWLLVVGHLVAAFGSVAIYAYSRPCR